MKKNIFILCAGILFCGCSMKYSGIKGEWFLKDIDLPHGTITSVTNNSAAAFLALALTDNSPQKFVISDSTIVVKTYKDSVIDSCRYFSSGNNIFISDTDSLFAKWKVERITKDSLKIHGDGVCYYLSKKR